MSPPGNETMGVRRAFVGAVLLATLALPLVLPHSHPINTFLKSTAKKMSFCFSAPPPPHRTPETFEDDLGLMLMRTARGGVKGTVIITAINAAWAEGNSSMLHLFLRSLSKGVETAQLIGNLMVVCLDSKAFDRCSVLHGNCYSLPTPGVDFSAEKFYMTEDYRSMMWTRLRFLLDVLSRGYSIIFTDTDIAWVRNPLERLEMEEDADIQISCDDFQGDPWDAQTKSANTGLIHARSNARTIAFFKQWYTSRKVYPSLKEQDVFNLLMKNSTLYGEQKLRLRFLETKYFGGFCQRSELLKDAFTMHANCCRGLRAKLLDLKSFLYAWSLFANSSSPSSASASWGPPDACLKSWIS